MFSLTAIDFPTTRRRPLNREPKRKILLRTPSSMLHHLIALLEVLFLLVLFAAGDYALAAGLVGSHLREAKEISRTIDSRHNALAETKTEISNALEMAIATLDPDNLASDQELLDAIGDAAAELTEMARDLVEDHHRYREDLGDLKTVLDEAPAAYDQAGSAFRRYADEESYEEIADDYRTFARTWKSLALRVEKQIPELEAQDAAIEEAVDYVEHTALFLSRLEKHLDALPDLDVVEERKVYVEQLKRYVKAFENFRDSFRATHDKLAPTKPEPSPRPLLRPDRPERPRWINHSKPRGSSKSTATILAMATGDSGVVRLSTEFQPRHGQQFRFYRDGLPMGAVEVVARKDQSYFVERTRGAKIETGDVIYPGRSDASPAVASLYGY